MRFHKTYKIVFLLGCSLLFLLLSPLLIAEDLKLVTNIFGDGVVPKVSLQTAFSLIFQLIISLAGVSAVVLFVIHGTHLIYAQLSGRVADVLNQRSRLITLFIGVTLLLTSYLILRYVSNQLVYSPLYTNLQKYQAAGEAIKRRQAEAEEEVAEKKKDARSALRDQWIQVCNKEDKHIKVDDKGKFSCGLPITPDTIQNPQA